MNVSDEMINFILCDDDTIFLEKIVKRINTIMMKNKMAYKIHVFNDYNNKFLSTVKQKMSSKIYILDIQTPSRSGIDIAHMIRERENDSMIIFLTGHEELGEALLHKEIMFLAFINKFDQVEKRLERAIKKSLNMLNVKNILKFEDRGTIYTINTNDILYITKDSSDRKTIIKTEYTEYKTSKPLIEFLELLDDRFIQTHRSCIINIDHLTSVNKNKRIMTFDDGSINDMLSEKYKKELNIRAR